MAFVKGIFIQEVLQTSDEGDDTGLSDLTTCFSDSSTAVSCVEVKVDERQIRFEKDTEANVMSAVTMRLGVNSVMTAGTNTFYAYTDNNSVTATGHVEYPGDLSTGNNDLAIHQALLDEIYGGGAGAFTIRVISEFGSKNKIGETEIEYTAPHINIIGVTKDDDDNIDDLMPLTLLRRSGGSAPYTWTTAQTKTSTVTTGAYDFDYEDDSSQYRILGQNTDGTQSDITPEVQGV